MRRFLTLVVLLCFTVPFGTAIIGCGHKTVTVYCNGGDSGPVVGQVASISLSPNFAVYGESLDFGQIGSTLSATAVDCQNHSVALSKIVYASSDLTFADINPATGQVCGGTFNRQTGGGIGDYTTCNPPANSAFNIKSSAVASNVVTITADNTLKPGQSVTFAGLTQATFLNGKTLPVVTATTTSFTVGATAANYNTTTDTGTATFNLPSQLVAYVTATAEGATSNAIPVFVHPKVTSVVLGLPSTNCSTDPDPANNCCPLTTGAVVTAPAYTGGSCLSQGTTTQLSARVYKNGTTNPADNITCSVGHLQYSAQNSGIFTIDQNGVATAAQPGSSVISASITNSGSGGAAGFFSTCPPTSITLSASGQNNPNAATVQVGQSQPLIASVKDKNGVTLTGINLTFSSTQVATINAGGGTVIPSFPGAATITASCQAPGCNSAPFSQVGLYGNGVPITSNGVQITAPGNNASVLYVGSTNSQYVLPVDFSVNQTGSLIKLPYTPNSMVITQDGSTIFFGSPTALMTLTTANNVVGTPVLGAPGVVLAAAPDDTSIVITDPVRKTVSLATAAGAITSSYGGVGVSAKYSPDGQTVYVTTDDKHLLVHSNYTGWSSFDTAENYTDVAVMVPAIGAFFATDQPVTEGRTYCPTTSVGAGNPPVTTNQYYPIASDANVKTDKIAATNDGARILGATVTGGPTLEDIAITLPPPGPSGSSPALACTAATGPVTFTATPTPHSLAGITATSITGVFPASNSNLAFVTYTGASGLLPLYVPATGNTSYVTLTGGATLAPVAGVFSTDNNTFFAGTSGDNKVHLVTVTGTSATDSSQITPSLPDANGNPATPNLIAQRVKKATT